MGWVTDKSRQRNSTCKVEETGHMGRTKENCPTESENRDELSETGERSVEAKPGQVLKVMLRSWAFILRTIEHIRLSLTFQNCHFGC